METRDEEYPSNRTFFRSLLKDLRHLGIGQTSERDTSAAANRYILRQLRDFSVRECYEAAQDFEVGQPEG